MRPEQNIKTFKYTSAEYQQALELRTRILRMPLGLHFTEEELKKDKEDIHFGLFEAGKILACLTLTNTKDGRIKMRQVAVETSQQGKGLGKKLSQAAEQYARENGFKTIFCHARKTAVPFYQNMGYKVIGTEFTEVNIPHFTMEKPLE